MKENVAKAGVPQLGVLTSSGLNITAPIHMWIVAIVQTLTPQQQQAVYNKVLGMTNDQKVVPVNGVPGPLRM